MVLNKMGKLVILCLAMVVSLSAMGIGYATSSKTSSVSGISATQTCTDPFTWAISNDDGVKDSDIYDPGDNNSLGEYDRWPDLSTGLSSNDPGKYPPRTDIPLPNPPSPNTLIIPLERFNKDAARTTWSWGDVNHQSINVVIENAYPYYYPTLFFAVTCAGGTEGIIDNITITGADTTALDIRYTGISIGQVIPAGTEAVGALHVMLKQEALRDTTYTFTFSINTACCSARTCGTAYAFYPVPNGPTSPYMPDPNIAHCFLNPPISTSNWGWTNGLISPGTYRWPVYVGAANCDPGKGMLAGWLTVTYTVSSKGATAATVKFDMIGNFTMDATYLWIGKDMLPKDRKGNYIANPGQFPYKHTLTAATTDSFTVSGFTTLNGNIYIAAHAMVCYYP